MPDSDHIRSCSAPTLTSVLICRGQNCGSTSKHPRVDHEAQLDALSLAAGAGVAQVTACTSQCHDSNVVVLCRHDGRRPERLWFAQVNDRATIYALAEWISDGAPDPVPPDLLGRLFGIDAARHLGR
jgi:hypothetical protein